MKKINDDLSINVLNIAAVEKRNNKCFLFMMDGDKYELTENDYDVIAAEVPTLKVDDNFYVNPNAVLTVETIYKNSTADHSIVKLVGDNVAQITLAEGAIVAAMEPTSGGGSDPGKLFKYILLLRNESISASFSIAFVSTTDVNTDDLDERTLESGGLTDYFGLTSNDSFIIDDVFAWGDSGKMILTDITATKTDGKITSFSLSFYNLDTNKMEFYTFEFDSGIVKIPLTKQS